MISIEELDGSSPIMGVYAIYCTVNGYAYVGSSSNVIQRIYGHKSYLSSGCNNKKLQEDYNRFGPLSFICVVLKRCSTKIELKNSEQYYIDNIKNTYNTHPATYPARRIDLIHSPLGRIAYNNQMSEGQFISKVGDFRRDLINSFRYCDEIPASSIEKIKTLFNVSDSDLQVTERDKKRQLVTQINDTTYLQKVVLLNKDAFIKKVGSTKRHTRTLKILFERGLITSFDHGYELTEFGMIFSKKLSKWNPLLTPYLD